MGKGMPGVFSVPPGPGLGHQLLPALLHHLHPVLRRPGLPVSPHVCQVGDQGHPCCSPIPPELFEPGLSSAVSHCFTSLSASPSSSCPGTLLHLPLPHDGPGFSPFLIPCISPLFPKFLMKLKVQGKKKQNYKIGSSALAENKLGIRMIPGNSLSTSIQVSAAPCKLHSNYLMSPRPVEIVMIFPGFAGFWRVTGLCGSPR